MTSSGNMAALKESALLAGDALKAVIATNRIDAKAWIDLGTVLPTGVSADVQGDFRNSRECFFEALALCRKAQQVQAKSKHAGNNSGNNNSSDASSSSSSGATTIAPVPPAVEAEAWLGLGASLTKTMNAEFPNRTVKTQKQCFESAVLLAIAAEEAAMSSSSGGATASAAASETLGSLFTLQMKAWLHLGASMLPSEKTAPIRGKEYTGAECLTQASLLKARTESWTAQRAAVEAAIAARREQEQYKPAETVISVAERVARQIQKQQKQQEREKEEQRRKIQAARAAAVAMSGGRRGGSGQPHPDDDDDESEVVIDMEKLSRASGAAAAAAAAGVGESDNDEDDNDDGNKRRRSSLRSSAQAARTIAKAVAAAIAEEDRLLEQAEVERAAQQSKYPVSFWLCLADAISVSAIDASAKEMAIAALESIDDEDFMSVLQNNQSASLRLICFEKAVEASPRDPKLWLALEEALAAEIERLSNEEAENTTMLSLENLNALQKQQSTSSAVTAIGAAAATASRDNNNNNNNYNDDDENNGEGANRNDDEDDDDDDDDDDKRMMEVASVTSHVPSTSGITTATDLAGAGNGRRSNIDKTQCYVFGEAFTRKRCVLKAIECAPSDAAAWLRLASLLPSHEIPVAPPIPGMPNSNRQQQQQQQTLLDGVTVVTRRNCLERAILLSPDHPAEAWIELAELLISGGGGGSYKFNLPQDVVRAHNNSGTKDAAASSHLLPGGSSTSSAAAAAATAALTSSSSNNNTSSNSSRGPLVPLKNTYTALQCLERALELDSANVRGWISLSSLLASSELLQSIPGSHFSDHVSQHVTAKIGNNKNDKALTAQNCVEKALSLNYQLPWGWQRLALMLAAKQEQESAEIDKKNKRTSAIIANSENKSMGKISKKALRLPSSVLLGEFVSTRSKRRLLRLTNQVLNGIRKSMPSVLQRLRPTNDSCRAIIRGKPHSFEQVLVRCVETNETAETWAALGQYLAGIGSTTTVAGYFVFDEETRAEHTTPRSVDSAFCWKRVVELDRLSMEGWSYLGASMVSDFVEVGGETYTREEVFDQARLCDLRTAEGLIQMGLDVGSGAVLCGAEIAVLGDEVPISEPQRDRSVWATELVGDILLPTHREDLAEETRNQQVRGKSHHHHHHHHHRNAAAGMADGAAGQSSASFLARQVDTTFSPADRSRFTHRLLVEKASAAAAQTSSHLVHRNKQIGKQSSSSSSSNNKKNGSSRRRLKEVLDEQVQYFLRAAALDPTDYRAWAYLGTALPPKRRIIIGENEESFTNIEALLRALKMAPDNGRVWLHLGKVLAFDDIAMIEGAAAKFAAPLVTTDHEWPPRNNNNNVAPASGKKSNSSSSSKNNNSSSKNAVLHLDRLQVLQVAANLNPGDAETWLYLGQELHPEDIKERMKAAAAAAQRQQQRLLLLQQKGGSSSTEQQQQQQQQQQQGDEPPAPLPTTIEVDGNTYSRRQCFECAAYLDETLAASWTHLYCCLPHDTTHLYCSLPNDDEMMSQGSAAAAEETAAAVTPSAATAFVNRGVPPQHQHDGEEGFDDDDFLFSNKTASDEDEDDEPQQQLQRGQTMAPVVVAVANPVVKTLAEKQQEQQEAADTVFVAVVAGKQITMTQCFDLGLQCA